MGGQPQSTSTSASHDDPLILNRQRHSKEKRNKALADFVPLLH